MPDLAHVYQKTSVRYEDARRAADEKNAERDYLQAFYAHAAAESLADVLTDLSSLGPQREMHRAQASYHNGSCRNLSKFLRIEDPQRPDVRDSVEVERAVWSITRLARSLMAAGDRVIEHLPGYIYSGLLRDFEALDVAIAKQRKDRHQI